MKSLVALSGLSIAANIVLGAFLLSPKSHPTAATQVEETASGTASPSRNHRQRSNLEALAQGPSEAPARPTWQTLAASDLKELVRRLRAAGCPEETIQDIILAEVNRRFAARSDALWPDRNKVKPFWQTDKPDPAQSKENRARSRQQRELQTEKSAMLVELLGVDPEKEQRKAEGLDDFQSWTDRRVSFLPESKREQAARFLDDFDEKMQDFYARNRGLWDAQSRAEQRQLEAERLEGLARFLTLEEVRDFDLRGSQLASQLSRDLRSLTLSREQYEALFDIRKKYGDSIYNYADNESKETRQQADENRKTMNAEIGGAFGSEFVKNYERSQDYSYQQLTRLARRNDLPDTTAASVYDLKDAAQQNVKQVQADSNMTAEQRQQALQGIRDETEKTLKNALGDAAYKSYLRQGGWWINNLSPASGRPPRT